MPLPSQHLLAFALLLWLPIVAAETSYVIDKLLVGVHEDKNLDSAIVKVLPTGTKLEVIERDGELAYIQDPDNVRGWVDGTYLTNAPPALLQLAVLEREKAALEKQVAALQTAGASAAGSATNGTATKVNALTKENTELKGKLSDERLRAGKLQSEFAALRAQIRDNAAPPDARIVELERDREELNKALGVAEKKIAELSARTSLKATSALVPLVVREYLTTIALTLIAMIALGFGSALYLVDVLNRRRHGGFRV